MIVFKKPNETKPADTVSAGFFLFIQRHAEARTHQAAANSVSGRLDGEIKPGTMSFLGTPLLTSN
jgi:hypothetical protein